MSKFNKRQPEPDTEQVIENSLGRFELYLEHNGKKLLLILLAIIVVVGGYFSYKYLYLTPRTEQASSAMFAAQNQFERDSFALALTGNASFDGFLTISTEYSNTPQGNIANHYAGICYLYIGEYQNAIDAFKSYDADKDNAIGSILTAQNLGLTGDASVELGYLEQGVKYYEQAAEYSDNTDNAPTYLKKAGMVNEELGNLEKALGQYEDIRNNYPRSIQARDISKFIARVQQQL